LTSASQEDFFDNFHENILKNWHDLLGLGLNFEVVFEIGFLTIFCDILDFDVLDPTLNITNSRLLKFSNKLKFGGP
jgi:hypothetical protein